MHFSSLFVGLAALTAQVSSSPILETKRQTTVQVVQQYVGQCSVAVTGDMSSLNNTVINSANDVTYQAEVLVAAHANLKDIAQQFASFAASLEASTSGLATSLTTPEVITLTASITAADSLIVDLVYTYNAAAQVFTADTQAAVQSEASAAAQAVQLFAAPLTTYAGQVQQISGDGGSGSLVALKGAASALASASNNFSGAVGVSPSTS